MKLRFFIIFLGLSFLGGCVSGTGRHVKPSNEMVSLPEVRKNIIVYHDSGQYYKDVAAKAKSVAKAVQKALDAKIKYPAVVMSVEDVLLSTFEVRRKQGFSDNSAASKDLESHVILSTLPSIDSSVSLFEFLLSRHIPVFLVSHRPEVLRISVMENLTKAGFSGWKSLYMMPPGYPSGLNYYEEVRKGLQKSGFNIIATVGATSQETEGNYTGKAVLYPNYIYLER